MPLPYIGNIEQHEIFLQLEDECIQTAAKRLQRDLAGVLLDDDRPDRESQAKYELLTGFLEQENFSKLRTNHPALAGGQDVRVRIFAALDDGIKWEIVTS